MGLMLGLNILDVLVFSGSVLKLIAKKIRKGLKSNVWSRQPRLDCLDQTAQRRGAKTYERSEFNRQMDSGRRV